jgi:CubicO group peptidase (beta-lactamase class C family)
MSRWRTLDVLCTDFGIRVKRGAALNATVTQRTPLQSHAVTALVTRTLASTDAPGASVAIVKGSRIVYQGGYTHGLRANHYNCNLSTTQVVAARVKVMPNAFGDEDR